jgi:hypothetical protein
MEIASPSFIPQTTRNRWAWGFAWASLLLMLVWNFMPYYEYEYPSNGWKQDGIVITQIWPSIAQSLYQSLTHPLDADEVLSIIASMAVILMAMIQFLLAPLWRVFSASRLLRLIPAGMCVLGMLAIVYFIFHDLMPVQENNDRDAVMLSLISLNLLMTAVALILYGPEHQR